MISSAAPLHVNLTKSWNPASSKPPSLGRRNARSDPPPSPQGRARRAEQEIAAFSTFLIILWQCSKFPNILFQIPESEILNPLLYPPPGPAHSAGRSQVGAPVVHHLPFFWRFWSPQKTSKKRPPKKLHLLAIFMILRFSNFKFQRFGLYFGSQCWTLLGVFFLGPVLHLIFNIFSEKQNMKKTKHEKVGFVL